MAEQSLFDRRSTAVLIMDFQYRQLNMLPEDLQQELITRANKVLAISRQNRIPIIHIEVQRGERVPETALHPGILIQPDEPILTKNRTGPFSTTNLDEVLKKQSIKTLVLLGIRTSGCILSTVRWAADIDYQLIVLSDCCADPDTEVHHVLMEKIFPRQASVTTAEEFFKLIEKS
jgi:nicotinamidase-related amidase